MAGAVMTNYGSLVEEAMRVVHSQEKASTISIQVGSATCEDAAGAGEIFDEFRKHIEAAGRSDIALRRTGCTGRCSREPIVGVLVPGQMPVKHEKVDPEPYTRSSLRMFFPASPSTKMSSTTPARRKNYRCAPTRLCTGLQPRRISTRSLWPRRLRGPEESRQARPPVFPYTLLNPMNVVFFIFTQTSLFLMFGTRNSVSPPCPSLMARTGKAVFESNPFSSASSMYTRKYLKSIFLSFCRTWPRLFAAASKLPCCYALISCCESGPSGRQGERAPKIPAC